MLLIAAGPTAWVNAEILSFGPLVQVGLISYPLYLWHWPVLVFQRILAPEHPTAVARGVAVVLALALAVITYWWVERPLRFGKHRAIVIGLCTAVGVVGVVGWLGNLDQVRPLSARGDLAQVWDVTTAVILIAIIVICVWDVVDGFLKAYRARNPLLAPVR